MKKIIFLLLVLIYIPVNAQVYKWVDKDGKVHFGDQPLEQVEVSKVEIKSTDNSYKSTGSNKWQQEYREKQQVKRVESEEQAQKDKKRQQACEGYKRNLHTLNKVGRIVSLDADGNRHYISDDERKAKTKKLKKDIKTYCK